MRELPQTLFDIYALALPRGHGFGSNPPVGSWQSDDGLAYAVVTRHVSTGEFGHLAFRRRFDHVWSKTAEGRGLRSMDEVLRQLDPLLRSGQAAEPMPPNTAPRPALYDFGSRNPSDVFRLLTTPSHHVAAWTLNQLYLSLPKPDKNWVSDCQTGNFHTRLWEAQLLASFREQGLLVTQPHLSPDFRIENRLGGEAWVEAVTANPVESYNHVNSPPSYQPEARDELFFGPAAVRFAKTLGSKLQRRYEQLSHVLGKPFMIALADFHAPASMVWSREALIGYLYGLRADAVEIDGERVAVASYVTHLLGASAFPAGLFRNDEHAELSAVIFSNACSISKFSRVPVTAGAGTNGFRYMRFGKFFDTTPGAVEGITFCLDITSDEYRKLWPQGYEPWSAELEVFHNPFARHPTPPELLPEATQWFEVEGELINSPHYDTSVLWSQTWILDEDVRMPSLDDFLLNTQTEN
ncbi:hypothetical protein [Agrobacterium tumefaciens]|uniref:hypothetical protein n=1 Tax=Agrobacterium tumefaciens TaxID=358 RepID=UPI001573E4CC|nr:hypothetical protein [Agrobacterium tumefaciens]WCK21755.1 hypothetical protein G6M09_022480 [Agrobacterium tumefaciens]